MSSRPAAPSQDVELERRVRRRRAEMEAFAVRDLLPLVIRSEIRATRHFMEWWRSPMNYVRLMELPLALEFLDLRSNSVVLDIGSPKLLALYLLVKRDATVITSDIEDYFAHDFAALGRAYRMNPRTTCCDARTLPFADASLDRVFSVSALEHIPDGGDQIAFRELRRVLKPEGIGVITVPAAPETMEEWESGAAFYWHRASIQNSRGETFYQTRFDPVTLESRLNAAGLTVDDRAFIAERPLRPPELSPAGHIRHNFHFLPERASMRLAAFMGHRLRVPLSPYILERWWSNRCHYLTRDADDPNIRQIVVRVAPARRQ